LKFGKFGPFFHGKSFVLVKIIFFRSKFGKISKKDNTAPKVLALLLDE
jgi:hypothetical protein